MGHENSTLCAIPVYTRLDKVLSIILSFALGSFVWIVLIIANLKGWYYLRIIILALFGSLFLFHSVLSISMFKGMNKIEIMNDRKITLTGVNKSIKQFQLSGEPFQKVVLYRTNADNSKSTLVFFNIADEVIQLLEIIGLPFTIGLSKRILRNIKKSLDVEIQEINQINFEIMSSLKIAPLRV